jgi:hypothetical protein
MFIPDPEFYPSRIPDLGSKNSNKRGVKKNMLPSFFVAKDFTKLNYFVIEMLKKKFGPVFIEL